MSATIICDNRNDPFHKALAMTDRLHQVNRMLDRACKAVGVDPVEVRLAMVQTLHSKLNSNEPIESPETERLQSYRANGT